MKKDLLIESFNLDGERYNLYETEDYLQFEDLFVSSGLEFYLDETEEKVGGFVKGFSLKRADGSLIGGSALAVKEGHYVLNDLAVYKEHRGKDLGELLFKVSMEELKKMGASSIYITAKVPEFFRKYGFYYLDLEDVPDIFSCKTCSQLNKTCHPKFMKYDCE